MKRLTSLVFILLLVAPTMLLSQGLATVAKKEEERRKGVKEGGKVYTNTDLKPDITGSVPTTHVPSNASPDAPSPGNVAPAPAPAPSTQVPSVNLPGGRAESTVGGVKDETYWRNRITQARNALERSRVFADALQSRLNALATDIVNRDDPAQRSQLELERQRALAEMDRIKKDIAEQTKAIADIEEEARKAGVPPGWLR